MFLSQKSVYNGHKRKHALKYQTLTTPDGLIVHLYGPFSGRNHDIKHFKDSQISQKILNDTHFRGFRVYGDQAYGNDSVLCCPYAGAVGNLSRHQRQVNVSMSRVRVSVEWSMARLSTIGVQVGVFLTNCITCAQGGNTISDHFRLSPPSLAKYLKFISNERNEV
ncbi:hypothetical protein PHMEG_00016650 [Phytophthora megakarya]|uniref:DDE Tnp4 domain-containing protein n=1 Tax=Phytophthora megakarya TaxID=4795 RepID=A0A225W0W2_9STRA|nr:hypothetical protein PHMEG_00016650 [Phytophthora megakarya]